MPMNAASLLLGQGFPVMAKTGLFVRASPAPVKRGSRWVIGLEMLQSLRSMIGYVLRNDFSPEREHLRGSTVTRTQ